MDKRTELLLQLNSLVKQLKQSDFFTVGWSLLASLRGSDHQKPDLFDKSEIIARSRVIADIVDTIFHSSTWDLFPLKYEEQIYILGGGIGPLEDFQQDSISLHHYRFALEEILNLPATFELLKLWENEIVNGIDENAIKIIYENVESYDLSTLPAIVIIGNS